jgi:hypothetical protein
VATAPNFRIFTVGDAKVATNVGITGLTIANGSVIEPSDGGGIQNSTGNLTLTA